MDDPVVTRPDQLEGGGTNPKLHEYPSANDCTVFADTDRRSDRRLALIRVRAIDHVVFTVQSINATIEFYQRVFGMDAMEFAPGRWSLNFGAQKFNLHPADHPIDRKVRHATPGSADLCLLTDVPLQQVAAQLDQAQITIVDGPVLRTGAQGPIMSLYLYDPDENLIEIANQL